MSELLDLKSIEGRFSPHDSFLRTQLERRKVCLTTIQDPEAAADYIGGIAEVPRSDEKWSISKELFPGIKVHLLFRTDDEFGDRLEAFFSGNRVRDMPGEDLADLAVAAVNHLIRYARSELLGNRLPEICSRI